MEDLPFFGYGRFTEEDLQIRVLGRRLEGEAARLEGFRVEQTRGYAYLLEDEAQAVEGRVFREMRPSDYWMLDDYQGLQVGLYRRRQVEVQAGEARLQAFAYVAGPGMGTENSDAEKE